MIRVTFGASDLASPFFTPKVFLFSVISTTLTLTILTAGLLYKKLENNRACLTGYLQLLTLS